MRIEAKFEDGELWMGMMPGSMKAADLRRDCRLALHSPTVDTPEDDPSSWTGEAKITGRGIELPVSESSEEPSDRFRIELDEVVLTYVGRPADHLVIESWSPDTGYNAANADRGDHHPHVLKFRSQCQGPPTVGGPWHPKELTAPSLRVG